MLSGAWAHHLWGTCFLAPSGCGWNKPVQSNNLSNAGYVASSAPDAPCGSSGDDGVMQETWLSCRRYSRSLN